MLAVVAVAQGAAAQLAGDLDQSCSIDVSDAVLLERHLTGDSPLAAEDALRADLAPLGSPDGVVDAGDLIVLLRILGGDLGAPPPPSVAPASIDPLAGTETTQNPIALSGDAPAGASVRIFVNGRLHYATVAESGLRWTAAGNGAVALEDGLNTIQVQAEMGGALSCLSPPVQVTYRNQLGRTIGAPGQTFIVTGHQVWTAGTDDGQGNVVASEPYLVQGDLQIAAGSVLTLQKGTELVFAGGATLDVLGGLRLRGEDATQRVTLTGAAPCGPGSWQGIETADHGAYLRIDFARIECALDAIYMRQYFASTSLVIRDSEIVQFSSRGIVISGASFGVTTATIERNLFIGNDFSTDNVLVSGDQHVVRIRDNVSLGSRSGIAISDNAMTENGESTLTGNLISSGVENGLAILYGDTWAAQNTITGNCIGVGIAGSFGLEPHPTLHDNNISDQDGNVCFFGTQPGYNLRVNVSSATAPYTLDLTDNWWGSAESVEIAAKISNLSPPSLVTVFFNPFLSAPWDAGGASVTDTGLIVGSAVPPPAGEPVWRLVGPVSVGPGEILTIPEGTRLEFAAGAQLLVSGTLQAGATPGNEIVFTSLVPQGVSPQPGDWQGIVLAGGTGHQISNAVFEYATTAVTVTGSQTTADLSASTLEKFKVAGIRVESGAGADIHDNRDAGGTQGVFAGNATSGIQVAGTAAAVQIRSNDVEGGSQAIAVNGASPVIQGNRISGANVGIELSGTGSALIADDGLPVPVVPGNEITGNCIGVRITGGQPTPVLHRNRIHANDTCPGSAEGNWNLRIDDYTSGSALSIDAEENWWGSAPGDDALTAAAGIRDHSEDAALPTVDFLPFYQDEALTALAGSGGLLLGSVSDATDPLTPGGTYTVVGSVFVDDSWTLDPGVTLEMAPGASLEVTGSLTAAGVAGSEVTIRGVGGAAWDGIVVSGAASSLTLDFARIEGAPTGVKALGTGAAPVRIRDSLFGAFSTAILLQQASNVSIERATIANATPVGTGVHAIDATFLVDESDIGPVRYGVIASGVGSPSVGSAGLGNSIHGFGDGIGVWLIDVHDAGGGASGRIAGNAIAGDPPPNARRGHGIDLLDASPDVLANDLRHLAIGIYLLGDSQPRIGESPPGSLHNTVTENRDGIVIEGNGASGVPAPVIRGNNLFGNDDANLEVRSYPPSYPIVIDARENYWGSIDPAAIRQQIETDALDPIAVDFRDPLTAQDGATSATVAAAFSTIFSEISRGPESFRPTFGETWPLSLKVLGTPVPVTLRIYAEADAALATALFEDTQVPSAGAVAFSWDGTRNRNPTCSAACPWLPDEAYVYTLEAQSEGTTFSSLPQTPPYTFTHAGPVVPLPSSFNVFENDFLKTVTNLTPGRPGRISLETFDTVSRALVSRLIDAEPHASGEDFAVVWDGRAADGLLHPDVSAQRLYRVRPVALLKTNAVLVQDSAPSVRDPDFDIGVSPPVIEVKPDPYLAVHSFDQLQVVRFELDQDAVVSVMIYAPGTAGPGETGRVVTLMDQQPLTGGTEYSFGWDGTNVDDVTLGPGLDDPNALLSLGGAHTFLIEAHNPSQPSLVTLYRGVLQVEP